MKIKIRTKAFIKKYLETQLPGLRVNNRGNPIVESYLISVIRERKQEYQYSPISYDSVMELRFSNDLIQKHGRRISTGQEMKINRFIARYIHEQINIRIWCELRDSREKGALKNAVEKIVREDMGICDDLLESETIIKSFQRYREKHNLNSYIYEVCSE